MKGYAKTETKKQGWTPKTVDESEEIPTAIQSVIKGKFFASEADEPFEGVALKWDEGGKALPTPGMCPLYPLRCPVSRSWRRRT